MKKVTTRMVAEAAGVSQSTVSRVLNRDPRISSATAAQVIRAMRLLEYSPETPAARRTVGILLPSRVGGDSYVPFMLNALVQEALKRRLRLEIVPDNDLALLNERLVSGAVSILAKPEFSRVWRETLNLPLVRMGANGNLLEGIGSVASDGAADLETVVDHLFQHGHRRIGFMAAYGEKQESYNPSRRAEGFLRAMRKRGEPEPERFLRFDSAAAIRHLEELINGEGVTALIVLPGIYALETADLLKEGGFRIPEDISLVAWEFENVSCYMTPPHTALAPELGKFAVGAFDLLEQLIERRQPVADLLIPGRLIERQSVAAPSASPRGGRSPFTS